MSKYKDFQFKCGVEIHQQLSTKKLFCQGPSLIHDPSEYDIFFERKLRAAAGESGKVDQAAAFEAKKNRVFKYEGCSSSACLVELDEEPPHPVNQEALHTAVQIAKLLNATLVDEVQFMRKTVVDGSNVSGFQRTALIAFDGSLATSKGPVKIATICLEEEAAKKIGIGDGFVKYRLDRLGVPLIEIATDASIKDPMHCVEVASLLGMVLRSTSTVRRGIGSIRQDVNLSIKGSSRVELKGFQEIRMMEKVIDQELVRLKSLKEHKAEVRKVNPDGSSAFLRPMPGAARMYPETDIPTLSLSKKFIDSVELPELVSEKISRIAKEFSVNVDLAKEILEIEDLFRSYVREFSSIAPQFLARVMIEMPKEMKSRFNVVPSLEQIHEVLVLLHAQKIPRDAVFDVLLQKAQGKEVNLQQFGKVSDAEILKVIQQFVKSNPNAKPNVVMGELMKNYRGKIEGKHAMGLIDQVLKE